MVCKGCLGMYQYQSHWQQVIQVICFLFFKCPLKRKNVFVWGCLDGVCRCLGVTWWCLEVSGWCVRVSGDVSIPNLFAKDYVWSDITFSSNALLYVKLPISEGVWMVSGWCLGVSGWSPSDSGCCLQGINAKTSNKRSISVTLSSYCIFFQWPRQGLFSPKIQTSQNANLARKECSNQKV